jgi:hypothetical protein
MLIKKSSPIRYWYPSCKKTNIWTDTNLLEVYATLRIGDVEPKIFVSDPAAVFIKVPTLPAQA